MSAPTSLRPVDRLRIWYRSSMANRIMVAAMTLTMGVLGIVGLATYLSLSGMLEDSVRQRLTATSDLARQRLDDRLAGIAREVEEMSQRSLVANGLLDSQGRSGYLMPFLFEQGRAHPENVELGLYDWSGANLASSSGQPAPRPGLVAEVINKETTVTWLANNDGDPRLLIAAPVRLPSTGTVEGVLIGEYRLRDLAKRLLSGSTGNIALSLLVNDKVVHTTRLIAEGTPTLTLDANLGEAANWHAMDLKISAAMPRAEAALPLARMQALFVVLAMAAVALTYLVARALSRRVTEPLTELSRHAQDIASDGIVGLRELEVRGYDEVGWMATAFNAMVGSLRQVYDELDERVRLRTRELAERELYLRAMLDNFPFMVWLKDDKSRFLATNSVMASVCGRASPQDMVGLNDLDIWPEELAKAYRIDDLEVMSNHSAKVVEEPILEHGLRVWYETYKKPVIDAEGQVLGTVGFARDITERKQAEEALRLRERAIMAATDGIVITDMTQPGQPIIFVNPAFERITGYRRDEVLGSNCRFLQGAERDQEAIREIASAIEESRECRVVLRNFNRSGQAFWNELTLSPVRDDTGKVTHYVGVQHDITQDVEATKALAASEKRLALSLDALRDGLWDWNMRDDTLYNSPSWARMLGYKPDELTGHLDDYTRCLPETDKALVMEHLNAHIAGETELFACEHRMARADGTEIWVSDRGRIVEWDNQGKPVRMLGTISDVTPRIGAEREILKWMERLDSILTLSPDGYVYFDTEGRVASVNLAFERMTGLLSGEVTGMPLGDLTHRLRALADPTGDFPDLVRDFQARSARRGMEDEAAGKEARPAFMHLVKPTLRVLAYETRMNHEDDAGILFLRDVTRETEVDRMKSEFLSTAAHELRTPMASIMGFSELLLRRSYNPETARDMLDTIHRQATRLTGLLNELLDLARIEARAGKDFKFARRDLGELVRDSVATALGGAGRVGNLRIAEGLAEVHVDAAKIQQALLNILSNAVKYSPAGIDIDIDVEQDRESVVTRVTDHGIGMKPEEVARVFERFFRADPSGNIPGTGLGMSLVKEIVERHGGHVEISSRAGQGTQVSLYLPAAEEIVEALAA